MYKIGFSGPILWLSAKCTGPTLSASPADANVVFCQFLTDFAKTDPKHASFTLIGTRNDQKWVYFWSFLVISGPNPHRYRGPRGGNPICMYALPEELVGLAGQPAMVGGWPAGHGEWQPWPRGSFLRVPHGILQCIWTLFGHPLTCMATKVGVLGSVLLG